MFPDSKIRFHLLLLFLCLVLLGIVIWHVFDREDANNRASSNESAINDLQKDHNADGLETELQARYEAFAESHRVSLLIGELPSPSLESATLEKEENGNIRLNDMSFREVPRNPVGSAYYGWQIDLSCFVPYGTDPSSGAALFAYYESNQPTFFCLRSADQQSIQLYVQRDSQIINPSAYGWEDFACNETAVNTRTVWYDHISEDDSLRQNTYVVMKDGNEQEELHFACKDHAGLYYIINILFEKETDSIILNNIKLGTIRIPVDDNKLCSWDVVIGIAAGIILVAIVLLIVRRRKKSKTQSANRKTRGKCEKVKDFFSSSFKYSKQTTAERWPVQEAGGCQEFNQGTVL